MYFIVVGVSSGSMGSVGSVQNFKGAPEDVGSSFFKSRFKMVSWSAVSIFQMFAVARDESFLFPACLLFLFSI